MDNQTNDPKFFDVKPNSTPPPTARPIIVGHSPQMPDPMVHRIPASDQPAQPQPMPPPQPQPAMPPPPPPPAPTNEYPSYPHQLPPQPQPAMPPPQMPAQPQPYHEPMMPVANQMQTGDQQVHPVEDMHVHLPAGEAARGGKKFTWFVLIIVLAAVVAAVYFLFLKQQQ